MKRLVVFCILVVAMTFTANAQNWYENFDSYVDGSQIVGQGGWDEWGAGCGGLVSSDYALSKPHSLKIISTSDVVHEYTGYSAGKWVYTTNVYIPSTFSGLSYFIMLNTYDSGTATYNWSVQLGFDSTTGMIDADCGSSSAVNNIPFHIEIKQRC